MKVFWNWNLTSIFVQCEICALLILHRQILVTNQFSVFTVCVSIRPFHPVEVFKSSLKCFGGQRSKVSHRVKRLNWDKAHTGLAKLAAPIFPTIPQMAVREGTLNWGWNHTAEFYIARHLTLTGTEQTGGHWPAVPGGGGSLLVTGGHCGAHHAPGLLQQDPDSRPGRPGM